MTSAKLHTKTTFSGTPQSPHDGLVNDPLKVYEMAPKRLLSDPSRNGASQRGRPLAWQSAEAFPP